MYFLSAILFFSFFVLVQSISNVYSLNLFSEQAYYIFAAFISTFVIYYLIFLKLNIKKKDLIQNKKLFYLLIIFSALALRALFLIYDFYNIPILSDDVYRFVWDGMTQYFGFNPYSYSPKDFPIEQLKQFELYQNINHKHVPTVYGPLLQLLFYLGYIINPSIIGIKILVVAFELFTLIMLSYLLRYKNDNIALLALYAFNPLIFIEIYNNVHTESILAFLTLLTIFLYSKKYYNLSLAALAGLTLTKYFALLFLPLFLIRLPLRQIYKGILLYFFIIGAFYIAYYDNNIFFALKNYSIYWEFNSPLFKIFDYITIYSRYVLGLIFITIIATLYLFKAKTFELPHLMFITIAALTILSPVLYPWYLISLLPLISLSYHKSPYLSKAFISLSGFSFLSYQILITYYDSNKTIWNENLYILIIEYFIFYALLFYGLFKKLRRALI